MKTLFAWLARKYAGWLQVAAGIAVVIVFPSANAADSSDPGAAETVVGSEAFNAAGEQATGGACASACHGWDLIFGGPRRVPREWDSVISDMVGRGAQLTDEQLALIGSYLKWSWGTVWINSATPEDLVAVLALSETEANSVVAYRDAHGRFTDIDSLKAVPGLDNAAIDEQADAIMFN